MKIVALKKEDESKLRKAFIKTLNEAKKPQKNGNNPYTKSTYATLTDTNDAVKEIAANNDFGISQDVTNSDDGQYIVIETRLVHELGDIIFEPLKLPVAKNDPQGYGSTITYGRRYALSSNLNLNVEDDDGNIGSESYNSNNQNNGYQNQRRSNSKWNQGNRKQNSQSNSSKPKMADKKEVTELHELINMYANMTGNSNIKMIQDLTTKGSVDKLELVPEPLIKQSIRIYQEKIDAAQKEDAQHA